MPIVSVGDQELEFPDTMSSDQIKAVLREKFPAKEKEYTMAGAANLGVADISSFGLDDELRGFGKAIGAKTNGLGLGYLRGTKPDPRPFSELIQLGIDEVRQEHEQAQEDHDGAYLGGQVAGAIIPAFTPGGQALSARLGSGGLGARVIKGATTGALSVGAYGFGTGEGGALERVPRTAGYAASGAVASGAFPLAAAGLNKLNTRTVVPTSEQVREAGSKLFQKADDLGGVLKPEITDDFIDGVLDVAPQTEAGKVFRGESQISKIMDQLPSLKGKPLTLQAAKEVDEALGDLAYGTMDKFGKVTAEGKKFLDLQTKLRQTIENADENMISGGRDGFEALKEARKLWSSSLRMRDIEKIIDNAQYFEQPATAIKTGFRTLLRNPNRLKGYTKEEIKAIKKAASTGLTTDLLRLAGSGLVPIGTGITGTATGGPAGGLAAGAAGYVLQQGAKKAAGARQMSRAQSALEQIARRSGQVKTEQRIPIGRMREIMKLPPAEARLAIEKFNQTNSP